MKPEHRLAIPAERVVRLLSTKLDAWYPQWVTDPPTPSSSYTQSLLVARHAALLPPDVAVARLVHIRRWLSREPYRLPDYWRDIHFCVTVLSLRLGEGLPPSEALEAFPEQYAQVKSGIDRIWEGPRYDDPLCAWGQWVRWARKDARLPKERDTTSAEKETE